MEAGTGRRVGKQRERGRQAESEGRRQSLREGGRQSSREGGRQAESEARGLKLTPRRKEFKCREVWVVGVMEA